MINQNRPPAWAVIAIHAVPTVGVVFFGWSMTLVLLLYWLENLVTGILWWRAIRRHHRLTDKRGHYRNQFGCSNIQFFPDEYRSSAVALTGGHGVLVVFFAFALDGAELLTNLVWLVIVLVTAVVVTIQEVRPLTLDIEKRSFAWLRSQASRSLYGVHAMNVGVLLGLVLLAFGGILLILTFIGLRVLVDLFRLRPEKKFDPKAQPPKFLGGFLAETWRRRHEERARLMEEDELIGEPGPRVSMAIKFSCSECGRTVRSANEMAGKRGRCPGCQTVVQIPQRSESATSGSPEIPENASKRVEFACPQCHRQVGVRSTSAGKKGRCPHCEAVVAIPSLSAIASTAPQKSTIEFSCVRCGHMVKTAASTAGKKGRCPRCRSVVDIPGGGIRREPLPEMTPPEPLAGRPAGPFATGTDAMVGLPQDGAGAGTPPTAMSPAIGAPSPRRPRSSVVKRTDVERSGVPWDHREHADWPFLKTAQLVLFKPTVAFSKMFRKKDVTGPLRFAITGAGIMCAIVAGLWIVLMILGLAVRYQGQAIQTPDLLLTFGLIIVAILVGIGATLINVLVGLFMNAGVTHLLLMAVGGAKGSFETTLRVHGFVMGTMSLVGSIPCVGLVLAMVGYPVYLILGVMYGHETTKERASFAVLLPTALFSLIFFICCCFNPLPLLPG